MKTASYIIIAVLLFAVGYYSGRVSLDSEISQGETITGSVPQEDLTPVKEETIIDPDLPMKRDTVIVEREVHIEGSSGETKVIHDTVFVNNVDTAAIIADYIIKRSYTNTLFNNKNQGRLDIFSTVYQNKLTALDYKFTPKIKVWQPFASTSFSTADYWGVGGGFFYHNLGIEYQYQIDLRKSKIDFEPRGNEHMIGLKYMFR